MDRRNNNPVVRGLVAGTIGAVALTLSERLEMSVSGRAASQVPGQVGAHLLPGADPGSETDVQRLNSPVHWAHGIAMGTLRAAIDKAGFQGPVASLIHFALVWGADAALYRALRIADLPWRWSPAELGTDVLHKGVYAAVTGLVYDTLANRGPARTG